MNTADRGPAAGGAGPMDDERALRLLMLDLDGRPVDADGLARAVAWCETHPACRAAWQDMVAIHEAMASEVPAERLPGGFAERVLAARREPGTGGDVLPLVRRMAAAAAIVLAGTFAFEAWRPSPAAADEAIERQRYAVDAFRSEAFGTDDLETGLAELLPDPPSRRPESAAAGHGARGAAEGAVGGVPAGAPRAGGDGTSGAEDPSGPPGVHDDDDGEGR